MKDDIEDRKTYRKTKIEQKNKHFKKVEEEYQKNKFFKKELKNKMQEIEDEETWEYWKDMYK
jgi:hypothetical protein